jgi:F0F1-type ATP synthase beta subunit
MDNITDYKARTPKITDVNDGWIRAFIGDDIPRTGDALGLRSESGEEIFAAVRRHNGARKVDAMLLAVPDWVREGVEVFTTGEAAHIPAPRKGATALDELVISAGDDGGDTIPLRLRSPSFAELGGTRPALATGYSAIDRLAPLADGGLNLVLDTFPGTKAFDALAEKSFQAHDFDAVVWLTGDDRAPSWATHHIQTGDSPQRQLTGIRLLMTWAAWLRDQGHRVLVGAELPPLTSNGIIDEVDTALGVSIGEVVDQLGSSLTSTKTGQITTLLRLPLHTSPAGIEHIIETMDVGDVDAQLYIDDQGRFDPYRSTSDAELGKEGRNEQQKLLSVLSRAASARDKAAMLGEFGLEEREQEALEKAEELQERLAR